MQGKITAITGVVIAIGGLWTAIQALIPKPEPSRVQTEASSTRVSESEKDSAFRTLTQFLDKMDDNKFEEAYEDFDPAARTLDKPHWLMVCQQMRASHGPLENRERINSFPGVDPPGVPPGKYMTFVYRANFQLISQFLEGFTLKMNEAGDWKMWFNQY